MRIYDNETSKIYSDLSPTATQEPQAFRFKKNNRNRGILTRWIWDLWTAGKKNETIQYDHKHHGHKSN